MEKEDLRLRGLHQLKVATVSRTEGDKVRRCAPGTVGAQDRPSQNMPQWLIDYFDLKSLVEQKGLSEPTVSLPLKAGNESPMRKVFSLHPYHQS